MVLASGTFMTGGAVPAIFPRYRRFLFARAVVGMLDDVETDFVTESYVICQGVDPATANVNDEEL